MMTKKDFTQPILKKLGSSSDLESGMLKSLRERLAKIESSQSSEYDENNHNNNEITQDEINSLRDFISPHLAIIQVNHNYNWNTPVNHDDEICIFLDNYLNTVEKTISSTPQDLLTSIVSADLPEQKANVLDHTFDHFMAELLSSPGQWSEICKDKNLIELLSKGKAKAWNQFYPNELNKFVDNALFENDLNQSYAILFLILEVYRKECPQDGLIGSFINAIGNATGLTYSFDYKKNSIAFVQSELMRMRDAGISIEKIGEELFIQDHSDFNVSCANPSDKPEEKIKAAMQVGSRSRQFMDVILQKSHIKTLEQAQRIVSQRHEQMQAQAVNMSPIV